MARPSRLKPLPRRKKLRSKRKAKEKEKAARAKAKARVRARAKAKEANEEAVVGHVFRGVDQAEHQRDLRWPGISRRL